MAHRRNAIAALAIAATLVAPACRFSGGSSDDKADRTSTTQDALLALGTDTSTTLIETTTTPAPTVATRSAVTAARQTPQATTRATTARPATPAPTATPHCTVSGSSTDGRGTWTVYVTSTFPNTEITLTLTWPGSSGNYTDITEADGSWTRTDRSSSMRGQRVDARVSVAGRSCSTSFTAS